MISWKIDDIMLQLTHSFAFGFQLSFEHLGSVAHGKNHSGHAGLPRKSVNNFALQLTYLLTYLHQSLYLVHYHRLVAKLDQRLRTT